MPVFHEIKTEDFHLGLWRIEEELSFFENLFPQSPGIKNEQQRLQWFATRHLTNELLGETVLIKNDVNGKPVLEPTTYHISLSHTHLWAAALLSKHNPVGIDIELIHPRVERIAHKFLTIRELESIKTNERIEKLILYWSAKEALYKLYGRGGLDFKSQLLIDDFNLNTNGELAARIETENFSSGRLRLHYNFLEEHVLTYVVGR